MKLAMVTRIFWVVILVSGCGSDRAAQPSPEVPESPPRDAAREAAPPAEPEPEPRAARQSELLEKCRDDDRQACLEVAKSLMKRRAEQPSPELMEAASHGCELGSLDACMIAGTALFFGAGGQVDRARGALYFERACAAQNEAGCLAWAEALLRVEASPEHPERLLEMLDGACAKHVEWTLCAAAQLLRERTRNNDATVKRDTTALLERACDQGLPEACAHLAGREPSRVDALCHRMEQLWAARPSLGQLPAPACPLRVDY